MVCTARLISHEIEGVGSSSEDIYLKVRRMNQELGGYQSPRKFKGGVGVASSAMPSAGLVTDR
jgi:hypothetical protein